MVADPAAPGPLIELCGQGLPPCCATVGPDTVLTRHAAGLRRAAADEERFGIPYVERFFDRGSSLLGKLLTVAGAALMLATAIWLVVVAVLVAYNTITGLATARRVVMTSTRCARFASSPIDRPADGGSGRVLVCQLTDLHVTSGGAIPYEITEDQPQATGPVTAALRRRTLDLFEHARALDPLAIALTGDITDRGLDAEWNEVAAILAEASIVPPLAVIPGNHDVSLSTGTNPDPDLEQRKERRQRFHERLHMLERGPWQPLNLSAGSGLDGDFPRVARLEGVTLFSLDSNRYPSHHVLSNAIGTFSPEQLHAVETDLISDRGPVVVLTHHHVAMPAKERWEAHDFAMIALDGERLLEILCCYNKRHGRPALVLHGHRHRQTFGSYRHGGGVVDVYGSPSSTLGQGRDEKPRLTTVRLAGQRWCVDLIAI